MIPIYQPYTTKESLKHVHNAIDSNWFSSQGKYLKIASEKLSELLGVKHVLLVNNGTSATHLTAKALKFKYPKCSKVIVPNNVYVAAWNSFLYDKELEIESIDCNLDTWNFNESLIPNHSYVLAVHNIGNVINVPKLIREKNIVVVEDNCEGFLGKYEGQYSGTASIASSISFFGNKNITTGEGGAVITNDADVYDYLNQIHGQGQSKERYIHDILGYNYRMTNIQAALLVSQLEILNEITDKKQKIFNMYTSALKDVDNVFVQQIEQNTQHSNWLFAVRVKNGRYDMAKKFFGLAGIETRPMFYPITRHAHLVSNLFVKNGHITNAAILNKECVVLPSYPALTDDEIKHITNTLLGYIKMCDARN